ncbi:hypothetical protein Btus_0112 [Kyrpidia tusciae DSM 2912]|uniref:Uncharacterized protein n=1 Tax=Kyrpidia tusciae (strain DSM 2912 / NBRC 15312 / T2) TaxID=562970 RepID=D5WRM9_KYRT2|nr:hypothetical protein Btus_0112 [Kyrpidia tusciae DSM 2912]
MKKPYRRDRGADVHAESARVLRHHVRDIVGYNRYDTPEQATLTPRAAGDSVCRGRVAINRPAMPHKVASPEVEDNPSVIWPSLSA